MRTFIEVFSDAQARNGPWTTKQRVIGTMSMLGIVALSWLCGTYLFGFKLTAYLYGIAAVFVAIEYAITPLARHLRSRIGQAGAVATTGGGDRYGAG